jgi:hypothetical protein
MTISMKVEGLKGLQLAVLRKSHAYNRGYKKGLTKAVKFIFGKTQRIVPVRTGFLKRSGKWEVVGDGFRAVGKITYEAYYAIYVHENVHHTFRRGKSAKFVQKPIEQYRQEVNNMILREMRIP